MVRRISIGVGRVISRYWFCSRTPGRMHAGRRRGVSGIHYLRPRSGCVTHPSRYYYVTLWTGIARGAQRSGRRPAPTAVRGETWNASPEHVSRVHRGRSRDETFSCARLSGFARISACVVDACIITRRVDDAAVGNSAAITPYSCISHPSTTCVRERVAVRPTEIFFGFFFTRSHGAFSIPFDCPTHIRRFAHFSRPVTSIRTSGSLAERGWVQAQMGP